MKLFLHYLRSKALKIGAFLLFALLFLVSFRLYHLPLAAVWYPSALCAALGDLAGALLFPTGAFFPGFTATAALTGLIYGLFLYKSRPGLRQCFFAALTNGLVVTLVLNTAMISWVFGPDFWPLLYTRLAEFGAMLLIQTLVMTAISRSDTLYGKLMQLRA